MVSVIKIVPNNVINELIDVYVTKSAIDIFFEQLHIIKGAILLKFLSVLPFLHLIANNLPIMCKS